MIKRIKHNENSALEKNKPCCSSDRNFIPMTPEQVCPYKIFTEGDDLYDAMFDDIFTAHRTILLEAYILKEDQIGRRLLAALEAAARRGIRVHIRLDSFGSKGTITRGTVEDLRKNGVVVSWSNIWDWQHPLHYQRRNHRKLLVVDGAVAYIGGFNIGEESSLIYNGPQRWRDTHIRLTGAIVAQAQALFWAFAEKRKYRSEQWIEGSLLIPNYGLACRYRLRCLLNERFRMAVKRIWLTTPYFVPDSGTQRRLISAARRGVDVRVLVPSKSDVRITQWAARMSYSKLLRAGVKVYEYDARILHAKTALVDEDWSTIGTSNLDYRSFFTNYELNFLSQLPHLNACLADIFVDDLKVSKQVIYSKWLQRPYLLHIPELIGWIARRWL